VVEVVGWWPLIDDHKKESDISRKESVECLRSVLGFDTKSQPHVNIQECYTKRFIIPGKKRSVNVFGGVLTASPDNNLLHL
jgi:hypothetical protein